MPAGDVAERLAAAYASFPLLFWVLGSVLIYTLMTHALWLARARCVGRSPYSRWLIQVGRFLFYLGIPYLALGGWPRQPHQGLLALKDLGWVGVGGAWPIARWLEAVGIGLAAGLVGLLSLALAWANANQGSNGARLCFPSRPWWALVVDVLYLEVHWAFYRGALAVALGDVYAGVFLGLGLVYVEWGLNPFERWGWRQESLSAVRWLRSALALITALIFLFTHNLWICLGSHWLLEPSFWQLGRIRVWNTKGPDWPSS